MRAFLFPHRLLTNKYAYIAALHKNPNYAQVAFDLWASNLHQDEIDYYQHKLVNILFDRFREQMNSHPLAGYFQNIQRQIRLRSQANFVAMEGLLENETIKQINIIALGETNEALSQTNKQSLSFDTIEWAVDHNALNDLVTALKSSNFRIVRTPRKIKWRNAMVVKLENKFKCQIQLTSYKKIPSNLIAKTKHANHLQMTQSSYWEYMQSRQAGLNARGDQVLFDTHMKQSKIPQNIKRAIYNKFSPSYQMKALFDEILGIF